jgi:hypothetical protein
MPVDDGGERQSVDPEPAGRNLRSVRGVDQGRAAQISFFSHLEGGDADGASERERTQVTADEFLRAWRFEMKQNFGGCSIGMGQ